SLLARVHGEEPPDDGYQGEYVADMAALMVGELGAEISLDDTREWGYRYAVEGIRHDLGRIGVEFDTWFSERSLHESGEVTAVLEELRRRGVVYEADGAVWLRSTD